MAGEMNGTNVLLYRQGSSGFEDIMGQLEITTTYTGSPIDVSNKSFGDFVTLLNGELSTKQVTLSGNMVYNGDSAFNKVTKSFGDFVTLLNGELSTKQVTLSGNMVYNGDSAFQQMRQDRYNATQVRYRLDYNGEKAIVLTGMLDSKSDSLPQGAAAQMAFSIASTGMPQSEVNLLSSDGFNLVTSDGLTLTAGVPLNGN